MPDAIAIVAAAQLAMTSRRGDMQFLLPPLSLEP